ERPTDGHDVAPEVLTQIAERLRLRHADASAQPRERRRDPVERVAYLIVERQPLDRREHRDAKLGETIVARAAEVESPCDVFASDGSGDDVKRELEIRGIARERP